MMEILRAFALALVCGFGVASCRADAEEPPPAQPSVGFGILQGLGGPEKLAASGPAPAIQNTAFSERNAEAVGREESERGEDHVETDRDAFTPATRLVGKGLFVLESAYSFIDNRGVPETHSLPEMLLRFGLLDRLEVRLGWNYEVGGAGNDVSGTQGGDEFDVRRIQRDSRINYGIKAALTRQNRWVPDSILIAEIFTPTSGPGTATQVVGTGAFGWQLPKRSRIDAALRYATSSEAGDHFAVWAPSVVARLPLGERWGVHAEYFGLFAQNRAENFVRQFASPGVHYLVTPNLELGVRIGWGLNDQSPRFFTNAGFGWRF